VYATGVRSSSITSSSACSTKWLAGACYTSNVAYYTALSPGLASDGSTILDYSVPIWTESTWGSDPTLTMFTAASTSQQGAVLAAGIVIFFASFGVVAAVQHWVSLQVPSGHRD
jgi:hypothetical protein